MYSRLLMDIAKCGELSGHGNVFGHRDIIPMFIEDKNKSKHEIIVDRVLDVNPDAVGDKINKINESFCTKANEAMWNERIIAFEFKYDIDWYIMISFLFMVNDNNDDKIRMYETIANAAAILCSLDMASIKKDPEYEKYLQTITNIANNFMDLTASDGKGGI